MFVGGVLPDRSTGHSLKYPMKTHPWNARPIHPTAIAATLALLFAGRRAAVLPGAMVRLPLKAEAEAAARSDGQRRQV